MLFMTLSGQQMPNRPFLLQKQQSPNLSSGTSPDDWFGVNAIYIFPSAIHSPITSCRKHEEDSRW